MGERKGPSNEKIGKNNEKKCHKTFPIFFFFFLDYIDIVWPLIIFFLPSFGFLT